MKGYLGDFSEDAVVRTMFDASDADGASAAVTGGTIRVYKDGSTVETTTGASFAQHDLLTGIYLVTIDTSSTAFYTTGSDYHIVLEGATVAGQAVNAIIGSFSIENRHTSALTPAAIADAVWDEPATQHTANDTTGARLNDAFTQASGANTAANQAVTDIAALNDISPAEVNLEVSQQLVAKRLDELLSAPVSAPAAGSLFAELTEDDGGVRRFTANALEQAPTGGSAPTAAEIADAVWTEAVADHSGVAGSAANILAAANSSASAANANASAAVTLINSLNDLSSADVGAVVDTALADYRLDELFVSSLSAQPAAGSLFGDLTEDDAGTQRFTANALENAPTGSGGITPSDLDAIADAVWGELLSGHTTSGSAGQTLTLAQLAANTASTRAQTAIDLLNGLNDLSAAQINAEVDTALADLRLDELFVAPLSGQPAAGSILADLTEDDAGTQRFTANALENAPTGSGGITPADIDDIADAVWDEPVAQHAAPGSTGRTLSDAAGRAATAISLINGLNDPSAADIAWQVWQETLPGEFSTPTAGGWLYEIFLTVSSLPTRTDIANAVWEEVINDTTYPFVDTAGYRLWNLPQPEDIWTYDLSGFTSPANDDQAGLFVSTLPNVTVTDIVPFALAKFANEPTGEVTTVAQSVARLAQGAGGSGGSPIGSGAVLVTMTITDIQGNPQQDTEVWITSDPAGENVVAGTLETNVQGVVAFALDPGVHYRWAQKNGVQFTNPQQFTVVEV